MRDSKIKTLILDFDGTIVESVGIKDAAFKALYAGYPDELEEIIKYHLEHNATVRFDKFKHIAENILHEEYSDRIEKELGDKFAEFVFESIVGCPYVDGAEQFLKHFYGKIPLYLVSASPEEELDKILSRRKLKEYFKKTYAIPWKKKDAIHEIVRDEGITVDEAIFIGDTSEDCMSAEDAGVAFIGRDSEKPISNDSIPIFRDLFEIKDFLVKEFTF